MTPRISRLVVGLAGGALGVGLIAGGRGGEVERRAVAAQLDAAVTATATRAAARDREVSAAGSLPAAVATDAATVRDLTHDELMLAPERDEVIELGQRWRDGRTSLLLRRPEGAPALAELGRDGGSARLAGDALYVTSATSIRPRERAEELTGVLALSRRVPLDGVRAAVQRLGGGARLDAPGGSLQLGATPIADAAAALTLPVAGVTGVTLRLAGGGAATLPRLAGGLLALLAGLGFALAPRRRRTVAAPPPAPKSVAAPPPAPSVAAPPPAPSAVAAPASELGRYTLVRTLGKGGMAEVYLARLTGEAGFAKQLALKVLRPEHAADPVAVDHFLDEARLAAQLSHPNIVQISDLGRAGDEYFIAMEYVEGADLARIQWAYQRRGAHIPLDICLAILRQVCAGLHAAHTAVGPDGQPLGLVHRDVKSANVFVAKSGVVKVGDFGIAKALVSARVRQTMVGEVKGTAEYMAPEQRAGQAVDARADQYGVGAIAYELLSGQLINLDLARLAHLGRQGWPHLAPLPSLRPDIPPALADCVMRALAYDPADRYPSCEQLEEALEAQARAHALDVGDRAVAHWLKQHADDWSTPATPDLRRTRTRGSPT